jgi:hypothetical protein
MLEIDPEEIDDPGTPGSVPTGHPEPEEEGAKGSGDEEDD